MAGRADRSRNFSALEWSKVWKRRARCGTGEIAVLGLLDRPLAAQADVAGKFLRRRVQQEGCGIRGGKLLKLSRSWGPATAFLLASN